jgi:hypothetical protein
MTSNEAAAQQAGELGDVRGNPCELGERRDMSDSP